MAFSFTYRRLFEVEVLHAYYLDRSEAEPYWNLTNKQQDKAIQSFDLSSHLEIVPTQETLREMNRYNLLFRRQNQGFFVGVEVGEEQEVKSIPKIPLPDQMSLLFQIKVQNPDFVTITHSRLRPPLPAKYYFTNQTNGNQRNYPSLALNTPKHVVGKWYEPNERVVFQGEVFEALAKTNVDPGPGKEEWAIVDLNHFYVTDEDRSIIPTKVRYTLPLEVEETEITLIVKNGDGNLVFSKTYSDAIQLRQLDFDFHTLSPAIYTLGLQGANGFVDERVAYISDSLYRGWVDQLHWPTSDLKDGKEESRQLLGISRGQRQASSRQSQEAIGYIEIVHRPQLGSFRLLEPAGHLRTEDNGKQQRMHPRFTVSFRSRSTYWRYKHALGEEFPEPINGTLEFENQQDKTAMITKKPHPLLATKTDIIYKYKKQLQGGDNNVVEVSRQLPNPAPLYIKECANGAKLCSEITLRRV